MKRISLILFYMIFVISVSYSQSIDKTFFFKKNNHEYLGVKKIISKSSKRWESVYCFDKDGFLIRHQSYYKHNKRSDYKVEYTITDTMLIRKEEMTFHNDRKEYGLDKYIYNKSGQCIKMEIFSAPEGPEDLDKPFASIDSLMYNDNGLLFSYNRNSFHRNDTTTTKYLLFYNTKKLLVKRLAITDSYDDIDSCIIRDTMVTRYEYNHQGYLIKEVTENRILVGGNDNTNDENPDIIFIYDNFDRRGYWTKCYRVWGARGERELWSKRKIKYW